MFAEDELLEIFWQAVVGFISFRYTEKFLPGNFEDRRKTLIIWVLIYAAAHIFFSKVTETWTPHSRFINIFPHVLILFALQRKFFAQDRIKQIFIVASFTAGWEILRFAASPLAHAIFSVWSPAWAWSVNFLVEKGIFDAEKIISVMSGINRLAIFLVIGICRGVQIGIFIFYLRTIANKLKNLSTFPPYNLSTSLNFQSGIFLIFPCVTVLLIDFTIRLMAFSADNGAIMLIYERVPETIFLLPVVSLLLLGVIISSVILFKNFVQYKEEEQKRILLENRVVEVHREISELEEIYSEIRGLKHDLRNHLENISAYARGNVELENYLRQMNLTIEKLNFADKTGNPITDIIFHKIRQQARKKNILFKANFFCPNGGRFDIYDLSVILNNALQNAIEAADKVDCEKFIEIKSYERGGLFLIEIENNFEGEINFDEKNFPVTTKPDKKIHGIGLENIRRCAKKYLGDVEIKIDKKIFRLTVMLYKKSDN